jgi:hypothetical protein
MKTEVLQQADFTKGEPDEKLGVVIPGKDSSEVF